MKNIHILCGGESSEHDISLRSAKNIFDHLDKEKYDITFTYISKEGKFVPIGSLEKIEDPNDLKRQSLLNKQESIIQFIDYIDSIKDPLVIPVIHGTTGEDGQIQGFLKTIGLEFVGNSITSSAICFDKSLTNQILELNNLPQAKYYVLTKHRYLRDEDKNSIISNIFDKCGDNVYVKPASSGSSIGVSKATKENIIDALEEAFKYDNKILIEEEMEGIELEVSVIGNQNPKASLAGSYSTQREIFDYTAKYLDKDLVRNVPHKLSESVQNKVRELALDSYIATGCEGFARVDIFMDNNNNLYVNEINTFPGMTPSSLSADLWEATDNTSFTELLDELIDLSTKRL